MWTRWARATPWCNRLDRQRPRPRCSSFQLAVPLVTSPTSPLLQPGVAPVSAEGRTEVKTDTRTPCGPPYGAEGLLTPDSAWVERRLPSSLCFYLKPPVLPGVRPALYPRGLLSCQSVNMKIYECLTLYKLLLWVRVIAHVFSQQEVTSCCSQPPAAPT